MEAVIQIDGQLVIGAGEAGTIVMAAIEKGATNSVVPEALHLASDEHAYIHTNTTAGYNSKKTTTFDANGDVTVEGDLYAANFRFTSDVNLKENINPLSTVIDVEFIEYNFKNSDKHSKRYGVRAQDVQKVLPELVSKDANGDLTVAMVDFLIIKVAELENKIKELLK